jgi:type I restriction enzyme S subunit
LDAGTAALQKVLRRTAVAARSHVQALLEDITPDRTLGNVLREPLRNGYSGRTSENGDGVRTLTLTAVTKREFTDKYTKIATVNGRKVEDLWLEPGDILVQRSNTPELVGTSALYVGPRNWSIFPDLLIRVRTNDEVLPAYAHLIISSPGVHRALKKSAKGLAGSMPKIDQGAIAGIPIAVPPIATQARMVQLASDFNARIERLRAEVTTAQLRGESLRRSLLEESLVGRLVSQDPSDEHASVLLQRIRVERASAQGKPKRIRRATKDPQERLL